MAVDGQYGQLVIPLRWRHNSTDPGKMRTVMAPKKLSCYNSVAQMGIAKGGPGALEAGVRIC